MRQFTIKLEQSTADLIERQAQEQGIKVTRYLRTLIEKGLVVDMQLQQKQPNPIAENAKSPFEISIAEIQVATYALLKKYGEAILGAAHLAQDEAALAQQKAKLFVAKALNPLEDI